MRSLSIATGYALRRRGLKAFAGGPRDDPRCVFHLAPRQSCPWDYVMTGPPHGVDLVDMRESHRPSHYYVFLQIGGIGTLLQ
jgi:hypothetical protein